MTPIPYTPDHYPTIAAWFTHHHAPAPATEYLIDGIILPDCGAIFFYNDPRSPALIAHFPVTAPGANATETIAALLYHTEQAALLAGKKLLLTAAEKTSLATLIIDAGWHHIETPHLLAKSWP